MGFPQPASPTGTAGGDLSGTYPNPDLADPVTVGTVLHGDGTAALPSISFASETDLGFYRVGAAQVALANGGANLGTFVAGAIQSGSDTQAATLIVNGPAGASRPLSFRTAGVARWIIAANSTAEGGANTGSNLDISARDDAGASLFTVLRLLRSTGQVGFAVGSAAAPSMTITGDEDTGLYRSGADVLAITAGGTQRVTFSTGAQAMSDGYGLTVGSTSGTKVGTAASQKLGKWNVTPVVQPSAWTQTYATASKTVPAITAVAPVGTAATNVAPWGFATQAQADALVAAVIALINTDLPAAKNNLNALIDDLQATGEAS